MAVIGAFVVPARIGDVRVGVGVFHPLRRIERILGFDLHMAVAIGD